MFFQKSFCPAQRGFGARRAKEMLLAVGIGAKIPHHGGGMAQGKVQAAGPRLCMLVISSLVCVAVSPVPMFLTRLILGRMVSKFCDQQENSQQ